MIPDFYENLLIHLCHLNSTPQGVYSGQSMLGSRKCYCKAVVGALSCRALIAECCCFGGVLRVCLLFWCLIGHKYIPSSPIGL